jgi:hypothetical protein
MKTPDAKCAARTVPAAAGDAAGTNYESEP